MMQPTKLVYRIIIVAFLFSNSVGTFGQSDSTVLSGYAGLRGMWQTGNLNQVSLMPNGKMWLSHPNHYAEILGTYHYIKVDGFEAKNDFWTNSLYQYRPKDRIYLCAQVVTGYAVSFRIDHSILSGIGGGVNIIDNTPKKFLQIQLHPSYLSFKFEEQDALKSFALGSSLRAAIPLNHWLSFNWEFGSYHSMNESMLWGGSNLFQLSFKLDKNLSINIRHQAYYNHRTAINIKRVNTQIHWGCQYSFSNIYQQSNYQQ